jgi:SSS family solute:Na+ symporter
LIGLKNVGGWSGLKASLPKAYLHSWQGMAHANTNPLGVEWFGLAMGLGFVLSFGYWCTDFLVIQTAMATDTQENARRVPLIAAIPKMFFPFLVILPGLLAIARTTPHAVTTQRRTVNGAIIRETSFPTQAEAEGKGLVPAKTDPLSGKIVLDASGKPLLDYDLAIPSMLLHYFPDRHSGSGPDGAAGQLHERHGGQCHRLQHGLDLRSLSVLHQKEPATSITWPWVAGLPSEAYCLSMATAYAATGFNNIMDTLQLVFSL